MILLVLSVWTFLRALFGGAAAVSLENLALRYQLAVLQRSVVGLRVRPFAERLIGSIRRECLDHVIVLNERHLRRLLRAYLAHYNTVRLHQALHNASPLPRSAQPPTRGRIVAIPYVGGLHHCYQRAA